MFVIKYISGIHALNLNCSLDTPGDWHTSAIQWEKLPFKEAENSTWGSYGIEHCSCIPEHTGTFLIANHIRALLDLIQDGAFSIAQGMRDNYICNDNYTKEIFEKVSLLKNSPLWPEIDAFMGREYFRKWLDYKKGANL